jgi:hypothetical protein
METYPPNMPHNFAHPDMHINERDQPQTEVAQIIANTLHKSINMGRHMQTLYQQQNETAIQKQTGNGQLLQSTRLQGRGTPEG